MSQLCSTTGFVALNNADLVSPGFIHPVLTKERPAGTVSQFELDNPPPGVSFEIEEDGDVFETRRQLPANSMFFEVVFRKLNDSPATALGTLAGGSGVQFAGGVLGAGGGSAIIDSILATTILGGVTNAGTDFTFLVLDAETKTNIPIKLTQANIDSGQVELSKYPLAVFSVTKEQLLFTDQQLEQLGQPSAYAGIIPIVTDDGQFRHDRAEVRLEDVAPEGATNLFQGIVKDTRRYPFRADNESGSSRQDVPFESIPDNRNDVTNKVISIDMTSLQAGDTLFMTASLVTKRRFRHLISHIGSIAQTSSRSGIAESTPFGFNFFINAFNFRLRKWRVPPIESADDKVSKEVFTATEDIPAFDTIEGWRHAETISIRTREMWAADQRGIVRVDLDAETATVVFPKASIRDQAWFDSFLADNNLAASNIEDGGIVDIERTGVLLDVGEETDTLLFDSEKIPYHRPFALALRSVSNFDSADDTKGIGYPLLDLINNGVVNDAELANFDLSKVDFEETPMSSLFPSAYGGFTCGGSDPLEAVNNGAFFNPRDPDNRFFAFVSRPQPEIESDWVISTPRFLDNYTTRSRIVTERMSAEFFDPFTFRNSIMYARTFPSGASLSSNVDLYGDYGIVVFNEDNVASGLAFHRFREQDVSYLAKHVEVDGAGTHARETFSDDDPHKFIGYNRIFGDAPSYSHARVISNETASICTGRADPATLFSDVELATDIAISSTPHSLSLDSLKAVEKLTIRYKYKPGDEPVKGLSDSDRLAAFFFSGSGEVIDTVALRVQEQNDDKVSEEEVEEVVEVDTRFYRGGPINLFGDIWTKFSSVSITARVMDLTELESFLVDADQSAVAFDKHNRLSVFYADRDSGNISVLLSGDSSKSWLHFPDIIRLVGGETATSPYVVTNKFDSTIRLFYVLNNSFLMYRTVDTDNLVCEDMFVQYARPASFDENSEDDLGLESYTTGGKELRKEESYFVCGDKEDEFLATENAASTARKAKGLSSRYVADEGSDLDASFEGTSFGVFANKKQSLRLFFVNEGKVSVKASPNFKIWTNMVKDVDFHKNFVDDEGVQISNLQLMYNTTNDSLYVIYFHNGMMFARRLKGNLIELRDPGGDDERAEQLLRDYLSDIRTELDESRPIFLVGSLDATISDAITGSDPNLLVKFNYPSATSTLTAKTAFIPKFESRLGIDETVRPTGYFTAKGLARVYYQSSDGFVYGLTVNDLSIKNTLDDTPQDDKGKIGNAFSPRLDVQMKPLVST